MSSKQPQQTVLSADCVIRGEMALEGDAVMLGRFEGDVRVGGLLDVGEQARMSGAVIAAALRLAGEIDGDVIAEHGIEMTGGAKLSGRLFATRLSIDQGASFEGDINVGPNAMQAAGDAMREPQPHKQAEQQDDAPAPLRLTRDDAEQADSSVIGSLLNQRRSKVLTAARAYDRQVEESPAV